MTALGPVVERIHRLGPIAFSTFLEVALYDHEVGFYAQGGRAGRRGDFLTSPEVGPLFGAVVSRALAAWWRELGEPDPFFVVEAGAGTGTLARAVVGDSPEFLPALRYLLVERSTSARDAAADAIPLEPAAHVLGAPASADEDEEAGEVRYRPGQGPRFAAVADLPAATLTGVILANELLDNLPFDVVERGEAGWSEVRVGEAEGRLVEVLVAASPAVAAEADRVAGSAAVGSRIPLQHAAVAWLRQALSVLERGRLVVIDYAATTAAMADRPWTDWARTFVAHVRGGSPLDRPGLQDVTCEVAVDQLARVAPPTSDRSQADFLAAFGIDELVARARETWTERAAIGDLAALAARSRIGEAAALTDPDGLGAFRVLEWTVPHL